MKDAPDGTTCWRMCLHRSPWKNSVLLHAEYYIKERPHGRMGQSTGAAMAISIASIPQVPLKKNAGKGGPLALAPAAARPISRCFEPGRMEYTNKDGELKLFQSRRAAAAYSIIWASSCRISASTPSRPSRSTPSTLRRDWLIFTQVEGWLNRVFAAGQVLS